MTELDRMQIVEKMFPNWMEHLNDGKVLDQVLDGLACHRIVFNRCSGPGCNNVARRGRKDMRTVCGQSGTVHDRPPALRQ